MEGILAVLGLSLLVLVGQFSVSAVCPRGVEQGKLAGQRCVSNVPKINDINIHSLKKFETSCKTSLSSVADCLESILDDCARDYPSLRRVFAEEFDVDAFRKGLRYFCDNRQFLVDNVHCIDRYAHSVDTCVKTAVNKAIAELKMLQGKSSEYGLNRLESEMFKVLCTANDQEKACVKSFSDGCGRKVGDTFLAIVNASRAPACSHPGGIEFNQGRYLHCNVGIMAIVGVFVILWFKIQTIG